jgi:hypothetical protein
MDDDSSGQPARSKGWGNTPSREQLRTARTTVAQFRAYRTSFRELLRRIEDNRSKVTVRTVKEASETAQACRRLINRIDALQECSAHVPALAVLDEQRQGLLPFLHEVERHTAIWIDFVEGPGAPEEKALLHEERLQYYTDRHTQLQAVIDSLSLLLDQVEAIIGRI